MFVIVVSAETVSTGKCSFSDLGAISVSAEEKKIQRLRKSDVSGAM